MPASFKFGHLNVLGAVNPARGHKGHRGYSVPYTQPQLRCPDCNQNVDLDKEPRVLPNCSCRYGGWFLRSETTTPFSSVKPSSVIAGKEDTFWLIHCRQLELRARNLYDDEVLPALLPSGLHLPSSSDGRSGSRNNDPSPRIKSIGLSYDVCKVGEAFATLISFYDKLDMPYMRFPTPLDLHHWNSVFTKYRLEMTLIRRMPDREGNLSKRLLGGCPQETLKRNHIFRALQNCYFIITRDRRSRKLYEWNLYPDEPLETDVLDEPKPMNYFVLRTPWKAPKRKREVDTLPSKVSAASPPAASRDPVADIDFLFTFLQHHYTDSEETLTEAERLIAKTVPAPTGIPTPIEMLNDLVKRKIIGQECFNLSILSLKGRQLSWADVSTATKFWLTQQWRGKMLFSLLVRSRWHHLCRIIDTPENIPPEQLWRLKAGAMEVNIAISTMLGGPGDKDFYVSEEDLEKAQKTLMDGNWAELPEHLFSRIQATLPVKRHNWMPMDQLCYLQREFDLDIRNLYDKYLSDEPHIIAALEAKLKNRRKAHKARRRQQEESLAKRVAQGISDEDDVYNQPYPRREEEITPKYYVKVNGDYCAIDRPPFFYPGVTIKDLRDLLAMRKLRSAWDKYRVNQIDLETRAENSSLKDWIRTDKSVGDLARDLNLSVCEGGEVRAPSSKDY